MAKAVFFSQFWISFGIGNWDDVVFASLCYTVFITKSFLWLNDMFFHGARAHPGRREKMYKNEK